MIHGMLHSRRDRAGAIRRAACIGLFLLPGIVLGGPSHRLTPFQLHLSDLNLNFSAERDVVDRDVKDGDGDSHQELLVWLPSLGIGLHGAVLHPKFLVFDLHGELGTERRETVIEQDDSVQKGSERASFNQYNTSMILLRDKAYAVRGSAAKSRTFRDSDFFSREAVDGERFHVSSGFRDGAHPFTLRFERWKEVIEGERTRRHEEETLEFEMKTRPSARNSSRLAVTGERFSSEDSVADRQEGDAFSVELLDARTFKKNDALSLTTRGDYQARTRNQQTTHSLNGSERVGLAHSPNVKSDAGYIYTQTRTDNSESLSHFGSLATSHQLYKSLKSSLQMDARTQDSESTDSLTGVASSSTMDRYGGRWRERYTKRIGATSRLLVTTQLKLRNETRDAAGDIQTVVNERHVLRTDQRVRLAEPNINNQSIVVTDISGQVVYVELLDYVLTQRGNITELERVVGGGIPNGAAVLVSYEATNQPTDSSTTSESKMEARLELFDRLLSIHAGINTTDVSGSDALSIQDETVISLGARSEWNAYTVSADYHTIDSELSALTSWRFRQSAGFATGPASSISITLSELYTEFEDTGREQETYSITGQYRTLISSTVAFIASGGWRMESSEDVDRRLATMRATFDFSIGRFVLATGYEFELEDDETQIREDHFFFIRAKRDLI